MPSKKIFDIYPVRRVRKGTAKTEKKQIKPLKKRPEKKSVLMDKKPLLGFSWKKKLGILLGVLFFCLIIFLHFSARAEIEIWPKKEEFSTNTELVVDVNASQPDFINKVIDGSFFSKERKISKQFDATGILEKKAKASGQIRVYNTYHLPQTLVATTRFISSDGKLFRSTETAQVPAGGWLDIDAEAAEPGPEYNIKPSNFSIPGLLGSPRYTAVYGKSLSAMQGGYIGQASQITKNDLTKAKNVLHQELTDLLIKELESSIGSSFTLLDEATKQEVLDSSCSKEEGAEAEKFECSLNMRADVVAFSGSGLKDWAREFILSAIPESKTIEEDAIKIEPSVKKNDWGAKKLFLELRVSVRIFSDIDIDSLKYTLAGKSLAESKVLLGSYPDVEKTRVRLFPFWIQNIPQNPKRIEVRLEVD